MLYKRRFDDKKIDDFGGEINVSSHHLAISGLDNNSDLR
jgi:hypothetical protein